MTCDQYQEWLSDAAEGTLEAERQAEIDAHCRNCATCRELLHDLKEIRAAAATLERRTPSPELWNAIAAKVAPDDASSPRRPGKLSWTQLAGSPTRQPRWGALAAAAALMMMLGTATWFGLAQWRGANTGTATDLVRSAASELQLAERHYENAIAALEQLTVQRDIALDPSVVAEIAQSLASIDRAIDDSRAALKSDPDSFVAQTSLLEALRMKVALLQETVSLMNARS